MLNKFKVVLLGEGCVGKTSIVLRYCQNVFNAAHITTLQASFLTQRININGSRVELNIWDTAGQERFHALGPIYYRNSNGAVLVYDITDEDSFQRVKNWVRELKKILGNDIPLIIVGNKMDLEKDRRVDKAMAQAYALSVGATHADASAKQNKGVEDIFLTLTREMLDQEGTLAKGGKGQGARLGQSKSSRALPIIDDDAAAPGAKGGCC